MKQWYALYVFLYFYGMMSVDNNASIYHAIYFRGQLHNKPVHVTA